VTAHHLQRTVAVHLGHDERIAVDQAVRRRLVDDERAAGRCVRHERLAGGGAHREESKVEVAGGERLGRRLLDGQLVVSEPDGAAGRAGGREAADVLVAALRQELEGDGADRTGRADDADPRRAAGGSGLHGG